jgi:hypothetical protein
MVSDCPPPCGTPAFVESLEDLGLGLSEFKRDAEVVAAVRGSEEEVAEAEAKVAVLDAELAEINSKLSRVPNGDRAEEPLCARRSAVEQETLRHQRYIGILEATIRQTALGSKRIFHGDFRRLAVTVTARRAACAPPDSRAVVAGIGETAEA